MKSNYKGVTLTSGGHIWKNGKFISASGDSSSARSKTIAYGILAAHNDGGKLPEGDDEMCIRDRPEPAHCVQATPDGS